MDILKKLAEKYYYYCFGIFDTFLKQHVFISVISLQWSSFHWGTNHSPAHSGWRTECWGNQPSEELVPKEWRQHLGRGMNRPTNSAGQFSVTNSFQHNSFPAQFQLPVDKASCSFKGEFCGLVWMANGARYPVIWQGKAVTTGSSPECTDGNAVWQCRTHGCAEVTDGNGCALYC